MTIKAIYENGVFRPIEPVRLAEHAQVEVMLPEAIESEAERQARQEVLEILSRSHETGQTDTAARHNEHQP